MDSMLNAAARALSRGDLIGALERVALRDDPPGLALRGIVMARLGDYGRARDLLKRARQRFSTEEAVARARCAVAEAEIALVQREIAFADGQLPQAWALLESRGDAANAAFARIVEARRLLLLGRLADARGVIADVSATALSPPMRAAFHLVAAGIAGRMIEARLAADELARAAQAAVAAGDPALVAEVEAAQRMLAAPAARLRTADREHAVTLAEIEALNASPAAVVDACRHQLRLDGSVVAMATRPVLFALLRLLAEAWPGDLSRHALITRGFRAKEADESHRARLRVEIGRLRALVAPVAAIEATRDGYRLEPAGGRQIAVLSPPTTERHGALLALLSDGEAWSSSALAAALGSSARTVQRALDDLKREGRVYCHGDGRARRWLTPALAGFPTTMLLPGGRPGG